MAKRSILTLGHPGLKKKNRSVLNFRDGSLARLVGDLKETMIYEGLIGIAAPQIGENWNVFVTQPRKTRSRSLQDADEFRVYVNPVITFFSKNEHIIYEGCGCVPGIFGPVKRPSSIKIRAQDIKGNAFALSCNGILARVIQHEYDHLWGIEFIEKITDYSRVMTQEHYRSRIRNSPRQKKASAITFIKYREIPERI